MLTTVEKLLFPVLIALSLAATTLTVRKMLAVIGRGQAEREMSGWLRRALEALAATLSQRPVLRSRPATSWFHAFVAWGFIYYFLVNFADVLTGYLSDFQFLGSGLLGGLYRLGADLLSVAVLVGIVYFIVRRFLVHPTGLQIGQKILLHPKARTGIRRDSAIVAGFILLHVGARFLGQSLVLAREGTDPWQPFASAVAGLWSPLGERALILGEHGAWWLALGLILAFLPYFPYSKHLHLVAGPFNFLLKPERPSLGAPSPMEFDLESEFFGSDRLETLPQSRLLDTYACIMCNRCQEVCPAYSAGTELSPSALEINKRYGIKDEIHTLAAGGRSEQPLVGGVLTEDAIWSCTTCGACVEICPVGNEPMQDIIDMRRHLTLDKVELPADGMAVLRELDGRANPWGYAPDARADWAEGMDVPLMADVHRAEVLFWVGCSGSFDPRSQQITQAVARLLQRAGVDFAILGPEEQCTGDPARRLGEEAAFQASAEMIGETLSQYEFDFIVTACPHCFNALGKEYADYDLELNVVHHSQYLAKLHAEGRLQLPDQARAEQSITYHDSCYLGRYNEEYEAPRQVLKSVPGVQLQEMPRNRNRGLCCGGGGGGVFYEMPVEEEIADLRLEEAAGVQPDVVASACPFCMTMFDGSPTKDEKGLELKDIAEVLDAAFD